MTFKDCARRPVFTRLANALSIHDAAKAVGVAPRTMDRYHVAESDDVKARAAKVLAQVLANLKSQWMMCEYLLGPQAEQG